MSEFFRHWRPGDLWANLPHALVARFEGPYVLAQCGFIFVTGLVAFWAASRLQAAVGRVASQRLPRAWAPTFLKIFKSVAPPLFWLVALWLLMIGAAVTQVNFSLVGACIDLLLAWIVIRVVSFSVRSSLASVTISVVAWAIAALNILDLYDPLVKELGHFPLPLGVSALTVIEVLLFVSVLLWLTALIFEFLQRQITRSQSLTPSLQALLIQLLRISLPALAVVVALAAAHINLTTLTVAFGAIGLGVGLGLQRLVANLVAGLSLLIGQTIRPGDIIEYKSSYGWVTEMGARYVTLRTRDGVEHLVPNDYFLENGVENWSHSDKRLRLHIPVGIAYESDVHKAIALCVEAAKTVKRVLDRPEPLCLLHGFGDSSVDLEIRVWIEDPRNGTANVRSEVMLAVWDRFHANGITFPFPQRDVHIVSVPDGAKLP